MLFVNRVMLNYEDWGSRVAVSFMLRSLFARDNEKSFRNGFSMY